MFTWTLVWSLRGSGGKLRCGQNTVVCEVFCLITTFSTGFVLAGFFPDHVPENIIPLGNLFSPNFGIIKVQGGCPMEKYSATLGLQPKKSVEFIGAEFVGDLQRDKQNLGHWYFIQRCLPPWSPMVPKLILDICCVPYTPGGCALFWEWKFIPKKAWPQEIYPGKIWVQPPVGTTHGIFLVTTVETCGNYRVTAKNVAIHALNYYLGTQKFHFRTPTP